MSSDFTGSGGAAYMSDRMDWETPADLFAKLDDEFRFTLDAAASSSNHKCTKYYKPRIAPSIMSGVGRRYFAIPHMAGRLQNGYASAAWRPAARTRPSSCSSHPVQIRDGGTGISSIARRSDFYRAAYGLRQTASRAALHHSRPLSWSCGRERDNNHGGTQ